MSTLYSFELVNNKIITHNENIKIKNVDEYLDEILKSYNYKTKKILNQIDIDFPRTTVIYNNTKINTLYEFYNKFNHLNNYSYTSKKKYNLALIVLMLCCQSSYGYHYENLYEDYCHNKLNLLLCSCNNNRHIKFICDNDTISIEIETDLIIKNIIENREESIINTKLIIDIVKKNDKYVFNDNCIYYWLIK